MRTGFSYVWLVAVTLAGACEAHNPASCADGVCTDPARPFCDVDGAIAGHPITCIAVSCTPGEFKACRGNDALTCSTAGNDFEPTRCEHGCSDAGGGCVSCLDNSQCEAPKPFCTTSGSCVECLENSQCTDPAKPACDGPSNACRGCAADAECSSQVCDFDTGRCVDPANVVYASPDAGPIVNCGTLAVQCDLGHTFGKLTPTRNAIKLAPGNYPVATTITLTQTARIHGEGATFAANASLAKVFALQDGADLALYAMTMHHDGAPAGASVVDCSGTTTPHPRIALARTTITTAATAVHSTSCDGTISRSTLSTTSVASADPLVFIVNGSTFTIDKTVIADGPGLDARVTSAVNVTNCVFRNNGSAGFSSFNLAPSTVAFSTFYNSPVRCGAAQQTATVVFSNNIVMSTGSADVASGTECQHRYEILQPQQANISSDHILRVDPAFRGAGANDFHLMSTSAAVDAADPASTTTTDFDGVTRPQGAAKDLGAFELH